MFRYVRNQPLRFSAHALIIPYEDGYFYPCIHHITIGQDRAVGHVETFREHQHDDLYHIVVYTQAKGGFSIEGKVIEATPGTIVCTSPGQRHDFVTHRKNAVYSEITLSFETPTGHTLAMGFEALLRCYSGIPIRFGTWHTIEPDKMSQLENLLIQISDHARSGSATAEYSCQRGLARLLDTLIWSCTSFPEHTIHTDERLVKVRQYIEQHFTDVITVDALAATAKISKGYLFRSFKKAYNMSPMAYQQQLRLEAAKTLLRATELRCNEVAGRCGYHNVQFFHRVFKKVIGVTPRQYRQQSIGLSEGR